MSGWIKLSRDLVYHDLWQEKPFSRGQAWVDLILLANHKSGFIRVAGEKIEILRGQCGWSQLKLSQRWGWSRGKVSRFFNDLKSEHMIDTKQGNRNTIVTICNYEKFQAKNIADDATDSTTDDATDGQQIEQQTDTNKKNKELKNKRSKYTFDEFYLRYPVKKSKDPAKRVWDKLSVNHKDEAVDLMQNYLKANNPEYYVHPSTYLNAKRWQDESPSTQPQATEYKGPRI